VLSMCFGFLCMLMMVLLVVYFGSCGMRVVFVVCWFMSCMGVLL